MSGWAALVMLAGDLDRARDEAIGEVRATLEVVHAAALDLAAQRLVELAARYAPQAPAPAPTEPLPTPTDRPARRSAAPQS